MERQRVIRQAEEEAKIMEASNRKSFEEVTITSEELNKIFEDWLLTGKGDLKTDEKSYEKIKSYINHRESMLPLQQKLAEQAIEKYLVSKDKVRTHIYDNVSTRFNKKSIGKIRIYASEDSSCYNVMSLRSFKYIIAGTDYKFLLNAFQSEDNDKIFIDFRLWVLERGGEIHINELFQLLNITLPCDL